MIVLYLLCTFGKTNSERVTDTNLLEYFTISSTLYGVKQYELPSGCRWPMLFSQAYEYACTYKLRHPESWPRDSYTDRNSVSHACLGMPHVSV